MIVAMQEKATEEQIDYVIEAMVEEGVEVHRTTGETQTCGQGVQAGRNHHRVRQWNEDRRRRSCGDGGALLDRERRSDR
jgi:hypothetical protein